MARYVDIEPIIRDTEAMREICTAIDIEGILERLNQAPTVNVRGINVLSLFDGISCGMVALERAAIPVNRYVSYEIDKNAIAVSKKNYPKIEQRGSVIGADFKEFKGFDLVIGGSPCQDLCAMGSKQGLKGEKSKLFFEYVRAIAEVKPKWFLLENNASMSKENKDKISQIIGCEPVLLNSGDFSAQTRKRLYWTNIPLNDFNPKNLVIKDILEQSAEREEITDKIEKYVMSGNYTGRKIETNVRNSIRTPEQKSRTIGTEACVIGTNTGISLLLDGRYFKPTQVEFERLQTLPDGYTSVLPYKKAVFGIGNGWTVDVISYILGGIKG